MHRVQPIPGGPSKFSPQHRPTPPRDRWRPRARSASRRRTARSASGGSSRRRAPPIFSPAPFVLCGCCSSVTDNSHKKYCLLLVCCVFPLSSVSPPCLLWLLSADVLSLRAHAPAVRELCLRRATLPPAPAAPPAASHRRVRGRLAGSCRSTWPSRGPRRSTRGLSPPPPYCCPYPSPYRTHSPPDVSPHRARLPPSLQCHAACTSSPRALRFHTKVIPHQSHLTFSSTSRTVRSP